MRYTCSIRSLVLIGLVALIESNNLNIGDNCQMSETGDVGTCKLAKDCPEAGSDLSNYGRRVTECGYQGLKLIVCCKRVDVSTIVVDSDLPLSVRKCKEYSKSVNVTVSALILDGSVITTVINRCGHIGLKLITGGSLAGLNEFPHSALLGLKQPNGIINWHCGGSLVSTRYVLTAAHCLKTSITRNLNMFKVRLGELVIDNDADGATWNDMPVEQIIIHPSFTNPARYHDIALLKLAEKVTLTPSIRPICLPTDDLDPTKTIATGWGAIEIGGYISKVLLKVVLESFNNSECKQIYRYNSNRKIPNGIIESQLCAGSRNNDNRDTCQGDSGGPLQIYNSDIYCMYTQVGITSYGVGCGLVNIPGIYTRLYNYVQWIESIIWAPGEDD